MAKTAPASSKQRMCSAIADQLVVNARQTEISASAVLSNIDVRIPPSAKVARGAQRSYAGTLGYLQGTDETHACFLCVSEPCKPDFKKEDETRGALSCLHMHMLIWLQPCNSTQGPCSVS